jgi:hypothetical protein
MTQNITEEDLDKFANVKLYEDMVRKHGKARATQKLLFILNTDKEAFVEENIECIDYGEFGNSHCSCGHALRYGFVVEGQQWGGTCLMYLMDYLNLPTRHIKDALSLMTKQKNLAKFGLEQRKIVVADMQKEYNKAKNQKRAEDKARYKTEKLKINSMIPLIQEGTSETKDVLKHLTEVEAEFVTKLLRDEDFKEFIHTRTWLGNDDSRRADMKIYESFFKWMLTSNLKEKQLYRVKEALDQYERFKNKDVEHLQEQQEFYDLVKENADFRIYLSKTWIGKPDKYQPNKLVYEKFVERMETKQLSENQWITAKKIMLQYQEALYIKEQKELREIEESLTLDESKDSLTSVKSEKKTEEAPTSSVDSRNEPLLAKYRKKKE